MKRRLLREQKQVACCWCVHEDRCRQIVWQAVPLPCTKELSDAERHEAEKMTFDQIVKVAWNEQHDLV